MKKYKRRLVGRYVSWNLGDFDVWPWQRLKIHCLSVLKVPLFSISCFLFLCFTFCLSTAGKTKCVAVPFYQLNSEIKHIKLDVLWMFYLFIPVVRRQRLWTWFPSPLLVQLPCSPWSLVFFLGTEGVWLISLSTQIFCFCCSCHISVRCGSSSSWNNEAMFHD